ncbi:MAG: helix-turn-helix domain-containing protein [Rubripirellula sp.]
MNKKPEKTVGSVLVQRLERFAKKLETVDSVDDLSTFLTVRKVKLNLSPAAFTGEQVKAVRESLQVSQAVFAEFLGVSVGAVRDWEQGINEPIGPVRRIMEEITNDLEGWSRRIRELANVTARC